LAGRQGPWWDAVRVGIGPAPLETEHGWLGVYHGVKQMPAGPIYRAGLVMFDLDEPARVIRRTPGWIMGPETDYEKRGDVARKARPRKLVFGVAATSYSIVPFSNSTSRARATPRLIYRLGRPR